LKTLILFLIITLTVLYLKSIPPKIETPPILPTPTSVSPSIVPPHQIIFNQKTYQYYYRQLKTTDTFKLIPNFTDPRSTSSQIIKANSCDFGINGGFYRADSKPLGFFYTDGKQFGKLTSSPTFPGLLLSQNHQLKIDFIDNLPASFTGYDFIFQTGPVYNLSQKTPNFIDEEFDRRHLIATDSQNQFFLFSISEKDYAFAGPRLQDIPDIFKTADFQNIAPFTTVLNLDGGTASAYFDSSDNIKTEELTPIGSFLCGKSSS
jgi:hypothetical protein